MAWAISRKTTKKPYQDKEYYCGEVDTYTASWTDSQTLAVTFSEDRKASALMRYMEGGYEYRLIEVFRGW